MAALDFPSSPTNGQTYENFIYDSSITAWRNQGSPSGLAGQVVALDNKMGLVQVVPTSIGLSTGTATISSNGTVTVTNGNNITFNGIFTSTYRNYIIVFNLESVAGTPSWYVRYASNGTATTAGLHTSANIRIRQDNTVVGASVVASNGWYIAESDSNQSSGATKGIINIFDPNVSGARNVATWQTFGAYLGQGLATVTGSGMSDTVSYDGFQIFNSAVTGTGTFRIYGQR